MDRLLAVVLSRSLSGVGRVGPLRLELSGFSLAISMPIIPVQMLPLDGLNGATRRRYAPSATHCITVVNVSMSLARFCRPAGSGASVGTAGDPSLSPREGRGGAECVSEGSRASAMYT